MSLIQNIALGWLALCVVSTPIVLVLIKRAPAEPEGQQWG